MLPIWTCSSSRQRVRPDSQMPTAGTVNLVEFEYDNRKPLIQHVRSSQTEEPDVELMTNQPQNSSIQIVLSTEDGEDEA
jgi:hypothetical protein